MMVGLWKQLRSMYNSWRKWASQQTLSSKRMGSAGAQWSGIRNWGCQCCRRGLLFYRPYGAFGKQHDCKMIKILQNKLDSLEAELSKRFDYMDLLRKRHLEAVFIIMESHYQARRLNNESAIFLLSHRIYIDCIRVFLLCYSHFGTTLVGHSSLC